MPDWHALLFGAPGAPGAIPGALRLRAKVDQVAQRLLAVMSFETGGTFSPSIRNQAGSGATGLLQFMPATARSLGTSTEALAQMTPEQQLIYVEQYLRPYVGRLRSLQDTYMAVLYPRAIGQPADTVLFRGGTAYQQNAGLDTAGKGYVTVGDAVGAVERHQPAVLPPTVAVARDWGQELFPTPAPGTAAAPVSSVRLPASQAARDWGRELFA